MTEFETRPDRYLVTCPCGYERRYSSELSARAVRDDHEAQCANTPEVQELDGDAS